MNLTLSILTINLFIYGLGKWTVYTWIMCTCMDLRIVRAYMNRENDACIPLCIGKVDHVYVSGSKSRAIYTCCM